jgi:HK97 family phage portal protein
VSDIVWTPEQGSPVLEPEVRGISWNNLLVSDDSYSTKWRSASDIRITPDKALQSTVVLSCCRIIAETIATLPLCVYRRKSDGSRELASDIPLYKVLNFAPNSWQTKFEFVEQLCMNLGLWGNSYSQIVSGRYGAVSELQSLHPSRMQVERLENGRLRYSYTNPQNGRLERYTQDQIMHVRWTPEPDGIKGMVPVEISRDAIALARSLEIHASKFWANAARPGVVLTTDGALSAEAAERLRENWERIHRGSERAYKTAILTGGMKATELGFTNEASQFVDSRKFQTEEICRVFRIPMHLVQGTSGGNLEVQGQEFVTYTLMPWLDRIQSAISRSLIYNDDLLFAEFDVRSLLRSDSNSRAGYYSTMMGLGIYSVNEVRRLEGLAPLGPEADKHFVAMNMQTLEEAAKPKPDPQQPGAPPEATGGVPSLPGVKTGEAPKEAEKGEASTKKPEPEDAIEESSADWEDAIEGRAFCATGEGGGTDNSCSGKSEKSAKGEKAAKAESLAKSMPKEISAEMAREKLPGYKPFRPIGDSKNSDHIGQATDDELRQFLKDSKDPDKSQKGKVGGSRGLAEGTPVALRIDIPAFNKSEGKTYAVTVHEGKPQGGKKAFGKPLGYDSLAKLKGDVRFDSEDEDRATVVAAGGGKTPLAVVNGKFDPSRGIPDDIDSWTPVGYDPAKSTYFYDKRTGDEIVGGTDAVSVGNTVFTRNPVRGPRNVKTRYRSEDRADEEFSDPPEPMHLVGQPELPSTADDDAAKSASIIQSAIGVPDRLVKVYRPVHKKAAVKKIMSGDMVTISRVQAAAKGKSLAGGEFEIVSKVVPAKSLHNGGDGLHEWGYLAGESRAFCATGEGGGIDNSCGSDPSGGKKATTQEVVSEILRSIEATGGFSVHPVTAQSPTTGYMCATVPNAEKIFGSTEEVTPKVIDEYFAKHKDFLSSRPKLHLGGWIKADEGKVYLDLSERFETEEEATAVAIEHKQIAIWDVKNKKEIRINYDDKRSAREMGEVRLPPRRVLERDRSRDRSGEEEGGPRVRGSEGEGRAADGELGQRAFCATGEGHGIDNSCAASTVGAGPARVDQIARAVSGEGVGDDPASLLKHVGKARQFEIIGAVQNNLTRNAEKNAEVASSMVAMAGASDGDAAVAAEFAKSAGGSTAARAHVSSAIGVYLASRHECPEVQFELKHDGSVVHELEDPLSLTGTPAYYSILSNKIVMNLDAQRASIGIFASDPKWFSTKSLAHAVAHEDGHRIHMEAIRQSLGIPLDHIIQDGSPEKVSMGKKLKELHEAVASAANSDREMQKAILGLSGYTVSSRSPREVVAEYYAKVRLGGRRSDALDRLMKVAGFPLDKLRGKKK